MLVRLLGFLLGICAAAAGQRVLLRAPAGAPPSSVRVGGIKAPLRTAPAKLGRTAAVIVLADWLESVEQRELAAMLKARLARIPRHETLEITVLRGGELIPLPPVKTAAALEKELAWTLEGDGTARRDEGRAGASASGGSGGEVEGLYDLLLATAPEGQEAWREWVWAGRLPTPREGPVRRYLQAKLLRVLGESRLRLVVWPEQEAEWLPVWAGVEKDKWVEGEWDVPAAREGFELREADVAGETWPVLALAPGFRAPPAAALARFLDLVEEASGEQAGAGQLLALRQGLELYPNYVPAVEAGARLAERLEDHGAAAEMLARLERSRPGDRQVLRRRAAACWKGRTPDADAVLRRAVEAMPKDAELLEWLARLRLAAGDVKESYGLFLRSLEVRPDSEVLWWIAADLAKELGDEGGERRALREALNREPRRADRRVRLIELSLRAGDTEEARRALAEAEPLPAEEPGILESYASSWERLGEGEKALEYWRKTVAAAPGYEPARLAVCRLLEEKEAWGESLKAAEEGLETLPASPGLHLARARALERLGRIQDARRALREAAKATDDAAVLEVRARVEEMFGGKGAVSAWGALLRRLEEGGAPGERRESVRKKLVRTALREGDVEEAARLMELPEATAVAGAGADGERGVVIPGGVKLLKYLSGIGGPDNPREYLAAFARAITQGTLTVSGKQWNEYRERVIEHYERLMRLREPFPLTHEGTEVVLDARTPAQRRQAQRALDLLGYRLRGRRGGVEVEARTGTDEARRQNLAAGLDLDDRAIEESLAEGKAYRFRIRDDLAPLTPGEGAWAEVMKRHANPLGFAGMLLKEPALARLYAGLVSAGQAAAEALTVRIPIRQLAEEYGVLLYLYGAAMALDERGQCAVPGGEGAEGVWQALAGASPREGARFLEALLKKDDGMLLAFFAALHGVTAERQRWFLRDAERARKFYRIMREAPEWDGKGGRMVRESPILKLFRELPLEGDGSLHFPGGPQVWQVAREVSDVDRIARLERRTQRVKPAEEEEILERMARERYSEGRQRFSQLENFLMVVRMEEALGRRLEPREALILTQQFSRYEWGYPLLTGLPGLGEKELLEFFMWAESVSGLELKAKNLNIGIVSHVALLEGLLQRAGKLDAKEAAAIFGELCGSMRGVEDAGRMADAAQKALGRIAGALGAPAGGLQKALEDALLGREETAAGSRRRREFRAVLAAQKTPPVDLILGALEAVSRAAESAEAARRAAEALERTAPQLEEIPLPKSMKPVPRLKELLELWRKEEFAGIIRDLRQRAARRRPDVKGFARLSLEGRRALAPWLELALRGLAAGYYFRPSDLPVSEDPWLLRKYWYAGARQTQEDVFPVPEFRAESEGAGSLPLGSVGGIAEVSGLVALAGQRAAKGFAETVEVKQVAALRSALLHRLRAEDLRAVRLAILAGREWVVEAAYDAGEAAELERRATGLVSPERLGRASRLLRRLRNIHGVIGMARPFRSEYEGLWRSVWECFSMTDLFWLGRSRRRGSDASVAWKELQRVPPETWQGPVQELGAIPLEHARSAMPRLTPLPPYESYRQELLPARIGERLSEISLALASAADEAGLAPEALALIAEPSARRLMKELHMSDLADFRPAVELWKRVRAEDVAAMFEEEAGKGP